MKINQIYLGDCLELMNEIADGSIDMILCDLPYGVTARNQWDCIIDFQELWKQWKRVTKENAAIVLTAIQPFSSVAVLAGGGLFKYEWIWRKQQGTGFLNAKKQPLRNHEQVLVFYRKQPTYNPQMTVGKPYSCKQGHHGSNYGKESVKHVLSESSGERYPLTVLDYPYDKEKTHPTQKPVALFEYLIKTYTNEGETVLDNCAGSGTTGVACKNTGRNFILIEKDLNYYQTACRRIASA